MDNRKYVSKITRFNKKTLIVIKLTVLIKITNRNFRKKLADSANILKKTNKEFKYFMNKAKTFVERLSFLLLHINVMFN